MQVEHKETDAHAGKLKRLCYVVTSFPQVSETFIVEEALSLTDFDVDFSLYAMKRGNLDLIHPSAKALLDQNKVVYTDNTSKLKIASSLLKLLLKKPKTTVSTLKKALNDPYRWRYFQALPYAQQLLETNTDYLHAHFADDNLCYAAILSEWTNIPFGFTAHGYDLRDAPIGIQKLKTLANKAHSIVTVSEFNKRLMIEKYSLNAEQIYVAYNGIRIELFKPEHQKNETDCIRLLNVGRLVPVKGQDVLLEAIAKVIAKGHKIKLSIIGEGPSRGELESQIHKLKLHQSVELLGSKSQQEVRQHMTEADIYIMPSRAESFGVACIEAMAMELPVIVSDAGGLPEIVVNLESGMLFESENISELVEVIIELIRNTEKRIEIGKNGRERVHSKFTRKTVTTGLITYCNSVL